MKVQVQGSAAKTLRSEYETCVRRHSKQTMGGLTAVQRRAAERLLVKAWQGIGAALAHNIEHFAKGDLENDTSRDEDAQDRREQSLTETLKRLQVQVDDLLVCVTEYRGKLASEIAAQSTKEHSAYLLAVERRIKVLQEGVNDDSGGNAELERITLPVAALRSGDGAGIMPYAAKLRAVVDIVNTLPAQIQSQAARAGRIRQATAMAKSGIAL